MNQKRCFECRFADSPSVGVLESRNGALCLELRNSGRIVVSYEDNACGLFQKNALVAYAMDKAYREGQETTGPREWQRDGAMGQAFDEGVREGGEQ